MMVTGQSTHNVESWVVHLLWSYLLHAYCGVCCTAKKFVLNFASTGHFFFGGCCKIPFKCLLDHHILRAETYKLPYLDTGFLEVTKT